MKVFYHSADLDGHCSAAIVKYCYPHAELIGINYGQQINLDLIVPNEIVFMVDFSLQPFSQMLDLVNKIGDFMNFVWIDHHISAINDSKQCVNLYEDGSYPEKSFHDICLGKRQVGEAACELTWRYIFPDLKMPKVVKLLGRYDVWDLKDPEVLQFQYGFRLHNTDPNNQNLWSSCFVNDDSFADTSCKLGKVILEYQDQENAKYCTSCAFETEVCGYKAIAINKLLTGSQLFKSIWDNTKYDIMLTFGVRKNGMWTVSFYTDKEGVDCSAIAKSFGGGGHVQAAGANFDNYNKLPFNLSNQQSVKETDFYTKALLDHENPKWREFAGMCFLISTDLLEFGINPSTIKEYISETFHSLSLKEIEESMIDYNKLKDDIILYFKNK